MFDFVKEFLDLPIYLILPIQFILISLRYLLLSGLLYWAFYVYFFKRFQNHFHDPKFNKDEKFYKHVKREIRDSIISMFFFLSSTVVLVALKDTKLVRIYYDFNERPLWFYFLGYVGIFFYHDFMFYWSHRIMHHKLLYRRFHHEHHLSIYPTPFAAFSFSPWEAVVQGLILFSFAFVMPVHISVFPVFTFFAVVMNAYGHLGLDVFSKKTMDSGIFGLINHGTHHGVHHRYNNGNYGLYLRMWDKICGTWRGDMQDQQR
jgi:lathosterol oxidase